MKPILHLAQQTVLKLATDPQGAGFAADLQAGSWKVAPPAAPQPVRGLTYAPLIFGAGPAHPLFEVALGAFPHAVWSEFYDDTPWSRPFLPRFATGECIGPQALFAVYGWRGAIAAPSWYRDDMTDEAEPKKYPPFATTSGPDV